MERTASTAGAQMLQGRGRRCFEVMNSLLSAGSWFQKPPELLRRPKSGGTCEKQTQIFSLAQRNAPDSASHSLSSLTPSTLRGFPVLHLRDGLLPGFCHFAACLRLNVCLQLILDSSADCCPWPVCTCTYSDQATASGTRLLGQACSPARAPFLGSVAGFQAPLGQARWVLQLCPLCAAMCSGRAGPSASGSLLPGKKSIGVWDASRHWSHALFLSRVLDITRYPWGLTAHIRMSKARRHPMTKRTVQCKGLSQHNWPQTFSLYKKH